MNAGVSLWQVANDFSGLWGVAAGFPIYLFALLRGDKTARQFAHVLAIAVVLDTVLAQNSRANPQFWPSIDDQLGIDALLLAVQTVLALRSPWHYPIVIAAGQLLIVIAGALAAAGLIARQGTLGWMVAGSTLIQLSAFAYGLIVHRTRRRRRASAPVFAG